MIIAGQKGTVKAENRKNAGAMFTIRFYKGNRLIGGSLFQSDGSVTLKSPPCHLDKIE